jgi:hypothetical protein
MILARIAQHLRRQDWAAITIELLIVVFGVFIGLQVNNWNEMRRDQAREHEYLVRIHADLETTLERRGPSSNAAQWNDRRLATQATVLDALRTGRLTDADRAAFDEGLMLFGFIGGIDVRWSAVEELKSTGSMTLVRDATLRDLIGQTDAYIKRKDGISQTFTDAINGYRLQVGDRFAVEKFGDWKGENRGVVLRYDLSGLAADASFINALTQIDALSRMKRLNADEAYAQIQLLHDAVAAHLGIEEPVAP